MEQFVSDVLSGDRGPVMEAVSAQDQLLLPSFSPDIAGASNSVFDTEVKVMTHSSPSILGWSLLEIVREILPTDPSDVLKPNTAVPFQTLDHLVQYVSLVGMIKLSEPIIDCK